MPMLPASNLTAEAARLAALAASDILDVPGHPAFDHVAGLAAHLFAAPIALVSFIDHDRQRVKGRVGTDLMEVERTLSFCAYMVTSRRPLVVPDLSLDERFKANPLVAGGPRLRFYAGAPLVTAEGHSLGALCILDTQPRRYFGEPGEAILRELADVVMDEVHLMGAARDQERTRLYPLV